MLMIIDLKSSYGMTSQTWWKETGVTLKKLNAPRFGTSCCTTSRGWALAAHKSVHAFHQKFAHQDKVVYVSA